VTRDPFAALGLAASPDLTDDDVRAAWRRVAAATHPDRADGGDPAAFAVAASAYSDLRTRFGRNEALAD
jgi:curved DNA-binding protein CbpA